MKRSKVLLLLLITFCSFFLCGCSISDFIDALVSNAEKYLKEDNEYNYIYPDYDYDNLKTVGDLYVGAMPSTGNVHALVFPVDFFDITSSKYSISDIDKLLFSRNNLSTFRSLSQYYYTSSYGKLNITGDVMDRYVCRYSSSDYEKKYNDYTSDVILEEVMANYANSLDLSKYDSDNDHYIDCVYLLYSRKYDSSSQIWWAYQTQYQNKDSLDKELTIGDYKISRYVWLSEAFFRDNISQTDTTTIIHETGHLLGLDDYYDYDENVGALGGLGGADMMDYNYGDHNSFSKIILGWITPYVYDYTKDQDYLLSSLTDSGQCLIIPKGEFSSIFSEYIIIEYFTLGGLNSTVPYFRRNGIRVLHVNATLGDGGLRGSYYSYFNYDNSDTDFKLLNMITPSGYFNRVFADDTCLFSTLDSMKGANYTWSDGTPFEFNITNILTTFTQRARFTVETLRQTQTETN